MEILKTENLEFLYPNRSKKALCGINLSVCEGEFITVCGKSGCGKTTLLRLIKDIVAPAGECGGTIYYNGQDIKSLSDFDKATQIGFVMQNTEEQMVTDKVWHELAFGLESLGVKNSEIRERVAEMASFFGMESRLDENVADLSGGEKQILALASIMVMQPSLLLLDEPTSRLSPVAAMEFIKLIERINSELGTTVILVEHRLDEAFYVSERVIVMEDGKIIADDRPEKIGVKIKDSDMFDALPTPMRIYGSLCSGDDAPRDIKEGRAWIREFAKERQICARSNKKADGGKDTALELKDIWFKYERDLPYVIKGLSLKINEGEIISILGGNGVGKTTMLSIISGERKPQRGRLKVKNGKKICVLPLNPETLFVKKTVAEEIADVTKDSKKAEEIAKKCHMDGLAERHPYDLSGGEKQRLALAKVLLCEPDILLLDEPTKGMDAHFKKEFGGILQKLKSEGVTIVEVSHDVEFCAEFSDRCAMVCNGVVTAFGETKEFFLNNVFYTTGARKMTRGIIPDVILAEDIVNTKEKENE